MIIVLKNADFSQSNIGTLSSWRITRSLGAGATYEGATSVDKGAAFSATVTIAEGYELGTAGVTVTMGGEVIPAATVNGNVITISIAEVTGNVVIKVPTVNVSTGDDEDEGGNEGDDIITETEYILLDANGLAKQAYYNSEKLCYADNQIYFSTDFPTLSGYTNKDGLSLDANTYANMAFNYTCTIVFTPDTLPVGSKISIANGYMYRLNYWTSNDSYSSRGVNTTKDLIIDSNFWQGKAYAAFNITTNPTQSLLSEDQRRLIANHEIFTITFA